MWTEMLNRAMRCAILAAAFGVAGFMVWRANTFEGLAHDDLITPLMCSLAAVVLVVTTLAAFIRSRSDDAVMD